jgi:hypothetical protein
MTSITNSIQHRALFKKKIASWYNYAGITLLIGLRPITYFNTNGGYPLQFYTKILIKANGETSKDG